MSSVISVRVNEQEKQILQRAATLHRCAVSSLMKKLAIEKLEDDYDLALIEQYEQEKSRGKLQTMSFQQLLKEMDL